MLIRKLRSLGQRDPVARKLFVQAFFLFPWVALGLKLFGFRHTQKAMEGLFPLAAKRLESNECHAVISTTARQVSGTAHYCQPWSNCLKKSLVLWGLLRQKGIDSELCIGVRRETAPFEAHAWLECQGYILNEMPEVHQHFAVFDQSIRADQLSKNE